METAVADKGGGGVVGVITPPLVAENFVCSNSNFSPTGAITPDHPPPLVAITPPPSENPVSAPGQVALQSHQGQGRRYFQSDKRIYKLSGFLTVIYFLV